MADGNLIWKYLEKNFKNDHPTIYIYCAGQNRSSNTAMSRIYNEVEELFCPPMNRELLKQIIKSFLETKKKHYREGKIKIKSIY